ncbi:MAG: glycine cleavage system aminomethyltransferase GcvT [Acetobacteraceae bacterium]
MSTAAAPASASELKRTPLYALHLEAGARMVPFAGYEMPLQYPAGILSEHLHTRSVAGLFDVSHMGQLTLSARSGRNEDVAAALETLVPADIAGLGAGRQRYTVLTNDQGGIRDDLMVTNLGDRLLLVLNAACKAADEAHIRAHLESTCDVRPLAERALLALQGPAAEPVLANLVPETATMRFMRVLEISVDGAACIISRSGYTGEDGFEISVGADGAEDLARRLLRDERVRWSGLGARDSLRLEAGLCLYGSDLDAETTPVDAALEWSIQKSRRRGGARAGGFPGAVVILQQLAAGASRRRVGLKPEGRAPVRGGIPLYADERAKQAIGRVTSGGFGPSINRPVAMGYVPTALASPGTGLFAEQRGKRLAVAVVALPFVAPHFKRG